MYEGCVRIGAFPGTREFFYHRGWLVGAAGKIPEVRLLEAAQPGEATPSSTPQAMSLRGVHQAGFNSKAEAMPVTLQ